MIKNVQAQKNVEKNKQHKLHMKFIFPPLKVNKEIIVKLT